MRSSRTRRRSGRDAGELAGHRPARGARDRRPGGRASARCRRGRLHRDRRHPTRCRVGRPRRVPRGRPQRGVHLVLFIAASGRARRASCSMWSNLRARAATRRSSSPGSIPGGRSTSCRRSSAASARASPRSACRSCSTTRSYDQPDVVRDVIGFGGPMDELPLMLLDFSLQMVWAPMLRVLADFLDLELDGVTTLRRAAAVGTHDRRSGNGNVRRRNAGRVPIRGARDGRRPRAAGGRARHPHRRRLRARLAPTRAHPAANTAWCSPVIPNLTVTVHGTEVRGARRSRWRQRQRGQPHRQRHPRGLCRTAPAAVSPLDLPAHHRCPPAAASLTSPRSPSAKIATCIRRRSPTGTGRVAGPAKTAAPGARRSPDPEPGSGSVPASSSRSRHATRSPRRWSCCAIRARCTCSATPAATTRSPGSSGSTRHARGRSQRSPDLPGGQTWPGGSRRTRTDRCTSCSATTCTGSSPAARDRRVADAAARPPVQQLRDPARRSSRDQGLRRRAPGRRHAGRTRRDRRDLRARDRRSRALADRGAVRAPGAFDRAPLRRRGEHLRRRRRAPAAACDWDGTDLVPDPDVPPRYRTVDGQTYGWDAVHRRRRRLVPRQRRGSERYAGTFRGQGISRRAAASRAGRPRHRRGEPHRDLRRADGHRRQPARDRRRSRHRGRLRQRQRRARRVRHRAPTAATRSRCAGPASRTTPATRCCSPIPASSSPPTTTPSA